MNPARNPTTAFFLGFFVGAMLMFGFIAWTITKLDQQSATARNTTQLHP